VITPTPAQPGAGPEYRSQHDGRGRSPAVFISAPAGTYG
jgi:hypothetical protein